MDRTQHKTGSAISRPVPWRAGAVCALSVLALLATACATPARTEYDREADFARYETFTWAAPEQRRVRDPILDSELLDRRIARAVSAALEDRGLREVDAEEADLLVTYHSTSRHRVTPGTARVTVMHHRGHPHFRPYPYHYYYPYHPYWGPPHYVHYHDQRIYQEGNIIIDIVDKEAQQLLWRGWYPAEVRQANFTEERVQRMVNRILRDFPPGRE